MHSNSSMHSICEPEQTDAVGETIEANVVLDFSGLPSFVQDAKEGRYWSIIAGFSSAIVPVQVKDKGIYVAAVFHCVAGYIKIAGPGERVELPKGRFVVCRVHRNGARWEFSGT